MIDYEGLNKHRLETKEEILNMLKEHNKVAIVRPTGYGKSHLIAELCNELPGKKLILEPGKEIINYMEKFNIEMTDTNYITYHSLLKPDMIELIKDFEQYDYIFLDEMHRALAEKWGNKLFNIFDALSKLNNKVKILGFSATPIRGDNKDVIEEIFNGVQIEPYYLADAILDNFLPIPDYHCGIYEIEDNDKKKMVLKDEQLAKQILEYDIDASLSKMFRDNLDFSKEHKIICFVDKISNIKHAYNNIIKWFGININVFEVNHNQSKSKAQKIIDEFISIKGINVLFCVNILNEGVHLPDVDCVIFLRKTKSNVIYNQQLGRVISTEIKNPIIFDLVNNADNPEWGYVTMFEEKAEKQNKKVIDLETKNKDKLKITLEQINLIEKLNKINNISIHLNLTDKQKEIINKNINNGVSYKKLSNELGIPYSTLYAYCKQNNINSINRRTTITNEQLDIIKKNAPNMTIRELSNLTNIKVDTLNGLCKRYNLNYVKRAKQFTKDDDALLEKYINEGKSSIEIAKLMNRSKGVIIGRARRLNLSFKIFKDKDGNVISYKKPVIDKYKDYIIKNAPNMTIQEMCEKTGINEQTLRSFYSRENINYMKQNNGAGKITIIRLTNSEKEFIDKNGPYMTCRQMANELNRSMCAIRNYCVRNNINYIKERKSKSK